VLCDRTTYPQIAAAERDFYGELIDRYADYMDEDTAAILRARLIDGMSEVQASLSLHFARETVNRKFHRGLEIINKQMMIDKKRGIV
jgi:DNA-directed RNA polymerase specialized sigma24 family protein